MTSEHVPSKRPYNVLAGPYGHPFHPALVTVPIGAFVASVLFDVASRTTSAPEGFAFAAFWLLVLGVVGAVVAGVVGTMDLVTIPAGTKASRTAVTHATVNSLAAAAFAVSAAVRWTTGLDDVPTAALGLSLAGLAVLLVGGWLGSKLAYTYGVRVARESRQDAGYR